MEEYLKRGSSCVLHAAVRSRRTAEIIALAGKLGVPVRWTEEKTLDLLPLSGNHKGLVLELREAPGTEYTHFEEFLSRFSAETGVVLLLDGVTDTHNFGALLRSADLFRVDAVIIPARRSAKEGAAAEKISSGASAFVSVLEVPNLARALSSLKDLGFWIYGADMAGSPADRTDLRGRTALVMGSEGKGLSRLTAEKCDALIRIPAAGHVDSFNVSVAGGILLYEIRRQQGFPGFPNPS